MEQEKKVLYTEEAVDKALELTTLGILGLLEKKEAEEELPKLPESLQKKVMAITIAGVKTRNKLSEGLLLRAILNEIKP